MNYTTVSNNARARFSENLCYLNYITSVESHDPTTQASLELKIMRGLFYVHLYSSLEKAINDLIQATITSISAESIRYRHFIIPFNTISLADKLKSFKDCGHKNFFAKAIEIFEGLNSDEIPTLDATIFSKNLQNIWTNTIIEVASAFGIKNFTIPPMIKVAIDEIVEKRNAVAHGRESAAAIGERFRSDILRSRLLTVMTFTHELIDVFDHYITAKSYLKANAKKKYINSPI